MRIGFVYKIDKVPIDYRACFLSLIKEAIRQTSPYLYQKFYDLDNWTIKPFCFSVYFQSPLIEDDVIKIAGNTTLYISTLDISEDEDALGINIYNGLLKIKQMPFPNKQTLTQIDLFLLNEKPKNYFAKQDVCFKTLSPIIITDKDKKPLLHPKIKGNVRDILVDEHKFVDELNYSIKEIVNNKIEFIPYDLKKEVIKHTIGGHLKDKGLIKLVGFKGKFGLRGSLEDLYKVYQLGIGFRRNQGFGMLDVV